MIYPLLSQYQGTNIETLTKGLQSKFQYFATDSITNFYIYCYNIDTASSAGLDAWGTFLGFPRYIGEQGTLAWRKLEDYQYRIILKLKALQTKTRATIPQINYYLQIVFQDFVSINNRVYCVDNFNMTFVTYVFEFAIPEWLYFIFDNYDVLPHPMGVGVRIAETLLKVFSFEGQGDPEQNTNFYRSNFYTGSGKMLNTTNMELWTASQTLFLGSVYFDAPQYPSEYNIEITQDALMPNSAGQTVSQEIPVGTLFPQNNSHQILPYILLPIEQDLKFKISLYSKLLDPPAIIQSLPFSFKYNGQFSIDMAIPPFSAPFNGEDKEFYNYTGVTILGNGRTGGYVNTAVTMYTNNLPSVGGELDISGIEWFFRSDTGREFSHITHFCDKTANFITLNSPGTMDKNIAYSQILFEQMPYIKLSADETSIEITKSRIVPAAGQTSEHWPIFTGYINVWTYSQSETTSSAGD